MAKKATKKTAPKKAGGKKKTARSAPARRRPSSPTRRKRDEKKARFIEQYRRTGNIKASAEFAAIDRSTVYEWQKTTPEFAEEMQRALDDYVDTLETEADRRAVEGVDEPVFFQGNECGAVRKYSDTLLMFRLNGLRPEKYKRMQRHEHTGKDGGPIRSTTAALDLAKLSDEQLDQLEEILEAAGPEVSSDA